MKVLHVWKPGNPEAIIQALCLLFWELEVKMNIAVFLPHLHYCQVTVMFFIIYSLQVYLWGKRDQ